MCNVTGKTAKHTWSCRERNCVQSRSRGAADERPVRCLAFPGDNKCFSTGHQAVAAGIADVRFVPNAGLLSPEVGRREGSADICNTRMYESHLQQQTHQAKELNA